MGRHLFLVLGWLSVGLGMIGVVLPVLPTVPFMILAAFLFAKGSPRARDWLLNHAHFGPHIRDWEARGAISRRAKIAAAVTMAGVFLLSVLMGLRPMLLAIQAACMIPAAIFVLTRPE
ncbi:YbaN family protein [Pseudoruegeria sp. HB172150]|uniref:YbaN family protein n=1 Tax=Pseudoruegeria sp. HB172150 TaxID=2721164 RepID=UPI001558193F|nr:YbaN family protein [Pseudoruegeria sp. HB172150]